MAYYQAKVKIVTEDDNGNYKKHTEVYLVNEPAIEAVPTAIAKEMQGTTYHSWELISVSETKILKVLEVN